MNVVPFKKTGLFANWFPVLPTYTHDSDVTFPGVTVTGADGLTLTLHECFAQYNDARINNNSVLSLTDKTNLRNLIGVDTPLKGKQLPITFTSTVIVDDLHPHYLAVPDDFVDPELSNLNKEKCC